MEHRPDWHLQGKNLGNNNKATEYFFLRNFERVDTVSAVHHCVASATTGADPACV